MTGGTLLLCRRLAWKQGSRTLEDGRHTPSAGWATSPATYGNQLRSAPAPEANAPAHETTRLRSLIVWLWKGALPNFGKSFHIIAPVRLVFHGAGRWIRPASGGRTQENIRIFCGQIHPRKLQSHDEVERMVMTREVPSIKRIPLS